MEITLIVTLSVSPDGRKNVDVSGPLPALADKFLCYSMLEGAKDAIRGYKAPLIQVPDSIMKGNGR